MTEKQNIHKSAGLLIRDGKLLVARSKGKDMFIPPGGKPENDETAQEALVREMREETGLEVSPEQMSILGVYTALAAGNEDKVVTMTAIIVDAQGDPTPCAEVEELRWIDSSTADIALGSILQHDILPALKERRLID